MKRPTPRLSVIVSATTLVLAGCGADAESASEAGGAEQIAASASPARDVGAPVLIGNGTARVYVIYEGNDRQVPTEIGIALDSAAMEGLPSEMAMSRLALPAGAPAPYTFVMLDWNPAGHEPPGVYDTPHFDFHFYTVPESEVMAIDPSAATFAAAANNLPSGDHIPANFIVLAPPGEQPAAMAVPQMGVHWIDTRAPELQGMLGNPAAARPFEKTFIYGSWNGRFTFYEPMITRDYLLGRPDEVNPIPRPARAPVPGWYPDGYRVSYDPQAREYRIALTGLAQLQ